MAKFSETPFEFCCFQRIEGVVTMRLLQNSEIFLVAESLAPVENSAHVTMDLSIKYLSVLAFL